MSWVLGRLLFRPVPSFLGLSVDTKLISRATWLGSGIRNISDRFHLVNQSIMAKCYRHYNYLLLDVCGGSIIRRLCDRKGLGASHRFTVVVGNQFFAQTDIPKMRMSYYANVVIKRNPLLPEPYISTSR